MKAFRVNVMGNPDHYLVTVSQKPALARLMDTKGATATIGENTIRMSSVRSIVEANVDLDSCPDYFKEAVERERRGLPKEVGYKKLPTEWIITSLQGEILATSISNKEVARVSTIYAAKGDPEKDKTLRFVIAKCHYRTGANGKEYYTAPMQVQEALICIPSDEIPTMPRISQRLYYGKVAS